jgi:hypothetical protein
MQNELISRVKRSYRLALELNCVPNSTLWSTIGKMRADVHGALLAESNEPLREIFSDPASTDLFYGVDHMSKSVIGPAKLDELRKLISAAAKSDISLLFHAVTGSEEHDTEAALTALDTRLRQSIEFPTPIKGEFGFSTSRGLASYRAIQAIYQAWRVLELTKDIKQPAILEIGPGLGRTAFYCHQAGLTNFTTIDLPLGVVAQAFFLGNALGPDRIWLLGDDPQQATGRVRLLPAGHPLGRFNLIFNVDSLVEMLLMTQIEYLRLIAKSEALFLSINHSFGVLSVEEVVRTFFPGSQANTKPYPMREGYAESCFMLGAPIENALAFQLRYIYARCAASVRYRWMRGFGSLSRKKNR